MKRPPVRVTKPAVLPVTLEEALEACRLEKGEADAAILLQIEAATDRLDGYRGSLGRALIHQVWRQDFDLGRAKDFRLPFPDVSEASAELIAPDGTASSVGSRLDEDAIGPFVRTLGTASRVVGSVLRVTFTAGFGPEPKDVPGAIRQAILLDVAHRYQASDEGGRIRSETVEGVSTTAFNSPEQQAIGTARLISDLLKPFRRGNLP